MYEELSAALSHNVPVPQKMEVLTLVQTLHDYDFHDMDFELINIMGQDSTIGTEQMIGDIRTVIETGAHKVLEQLGLKVYADNFSLLNAVLRGLKLIEDYEDSETIISTTSDEVDNTQVLSDLLALVTDWEWSDFAQVLGDVPRGLLERIITVHEEHIQDQESEAEETVEAVEERQRIANYRERVKRYLTHHKDIAFARNLLDQGFRLGYEPKHYINAVFDELVEFEENKKAERVAHEMVALMLMSNIPIAQLRNTIGEWLEKIYTDMTFVTNIDVAVTDEMPKVTNNGQA